MKIFAKAKDGGPDSTVTGYWLCEFKNLFSVVLLRFDDGSRDAYHEHAFNSWNWVLHGSLIESFFPYNSEATRIHEPSWRPVLTLRKTFHRVFSLGTTWVLSFRGPWSRTWNEYTPGDATLRRLTHGRVVESSVSPRKANNVG